MGSFAARVVMPAKVDFSAHDVCSDSEILDLWDDAIWHDDAVVVLTFDEDPDDVAVEASPPLTTFGGYAARSAEPNGVSDGGWAWDDDLLVIGSQAEFEAFYG